MPDVIHFTVHGEARPAGSKTAMPCWDAKKGDYRRTKTGRIITNVMHAKTKTKEPVIVTKRGKPLAEVVPFSTNKPAPGKLSEALVFEKDIVFPLGEDMWNVSK